MHDYLFEVIDRNNLSEMLKAFHSVTGLATYLMGREGDIVLQYGPTYPYCNYIYSHIPLSLCHKSRIDAGKMAMSLGSSYVFSCHANMTHIAFPLINKGTFLGSIQVGPFLMGPPESSLITNIQKKFPEFNSSDLMHLYDYASDIPQVTPERVTQLSRLFYFLMSSLIVDSKERFIINEKKAKQQARISDAISNYKKTEITASLPYPIDEEHELIEQIKSSNPEKAKRALSDLLAILFLKNSYNITLLRNRAVEIMSIMSHTALECGAPSKDIYLLSDQFIFNIPTIGTTEELVYAMEELLSGIMDSLPPLGAENSKSIREAISFIQKNYTRQISLEEVASEVNLNAAYFSRLFKQTINMTFKEYLTSIRIDEAKRLLRHTSYSIIDIAIAVGFENQSYFSQVFKKSTGITPAKYRS